MGVSNLEFTIKISCPVKRSLVNQMVHSELTECVILPNNWPEVCHLLPAYRRLLGLVSCYESGFVYTAVNSCCDI